ncbi:MAG TPA: VOC family protein [Vicinamibacterales bacterium]|nr:VOC family protein [Vicinamibacterales bacterium]
MPSLLFVIALLVAPSVVDRAPAPSRAGHSAASQQPSPARAAQPAAPLFTTVGAFFALSVADLPASVAWYSEKFGLRTVMSTPGPNNGSVAVLEGSGLIVELVQLRDAVPLAKAAPSLRDKEFVHGFFKAGIVVDNFDALVAGLKSRRLEIAYGPFPARPGQRANVIIRDNAGNLIQFFGR